jgi:hypothetical protein
VDVLAWDDFWRNARVVARKDIMQMPYGTDTCRNDLIGNVDIRVLFSLS